MPSPVDPIAIAIGGIEVRWYALFLLAGTVSGLTLTRALAGRLGLDRDWVLDVAPWIVLFSIVGARAYYVVLRADHFLAVPGEAINLRLGGLAFHGALVAGATTFGVLCWRHQQPFWQWTDVVMPGVALAQAVGRWGNLANQEAFGLPTSLPWGLQIDAARRPARYVDFDRFHPTFLYESAFNAANAVLLTWLAFRTPRSRTMRHGDVLATYLVTYGLARFFIERLRTDSLYLGPAPAAFWLSWLLIAVGLALFVARRRGEMDGTRRLATAEHERIATD